MSQWVYIVLFEDISNDCDVVVNRVFSDSESAAAYVSSKCKGEPYGYHYYIECHEVQP